MPFESSWVRLLAIVGIAAGAHGLALLVRGASRAILRTRIRSEAKLLTVTGFATSAIVFAVYFAAFGFLLSELGISLTTYLASASVIGLAVSFGSQGVVQDVINGLTVVFSDLIDVGDMVDIGGQVGIVESVGMRFTVLVNFSGARVFVPNRLIANVINYPNGYIRAYVDAWLPADAALHDEAERRVREVARAAYEQYPGIMLLPPTVEERHRTSAGFSYLRIKFRIWPGQGSVVDGPAKSLVTQTMKQLDEKYGDWMVSVHYRAERRGDGEGLPRPAALSRRRPERDRARGPVSNR